MGQIDPAAEVRKMYKNYAIPGGPQIYDAVAPSGAGQSMPYVVIKTVDAAPIGMRDGAPEYRAIVNIDIWQEFREQGGSVGVDDVSSEILGNMVPSDQRDLPPLTTLSHILSRFIRTTTLTEYIGSVQGFGKRIVIEHFLKLPG